MSFFVAFLIALVLCYIVFILPTKWLKVEYEKTDLGINKKALQISDIHIKNLRIDVKKIKKIMKKEMPDFIFYTGDFVDKDENELILLDRFLFELSKEGVPAFAVLGNHDRYLANVEKLENVLVKNKVILLKNEFVINEEFVLIGIDDFCEGYHDIEKSFDFKEREKKKIVLTHDPNVVSTVLHDFDIMLSGHLHGKQLNVPFLFKIKPMGELPSKGIYKGKHCLPNGKLYISKGIGQTRFNVRIFVRSEITIHHF